MYSDGGWASDITTTNSARKKAPETVAVFAPFHCEWRAKAEKRLLELYGLQPGWDGHRGKPANRSVVEYAASVLGALMRPGIPMPSIVPLSGGGLQFEWHRNGWDVEIEVLAPNVMHAYTCDIRNKEEDEFVINNNLSLLRNAILNIKNQ